MPLIGRTRELEALAEPLENARTGRSGVLVVRGEAGIGKSVLLDDAARRAQSFLVARASGERTRREIPVVVLDRIESSA